MLRRLEIRDVALIESLEIDFEPGLNLITGETGAGKSILLDALGLALGFRADHSVIRSKAAVARVQAIFDLPASEVDSWAHWLDARGLPETPGEICLRREVSSLGRSRAWINDQSVTLASLAEAADRLVDFQGQHEHQTLLRTKEHLVFLDTFGVLHTELKELALAWRRAKDSQEALSSGQLSEDERRRRTQDLRDLVSELDEVNLEAGERERLMKSRHSAQNAGRLAEGLARSATLLSSQDENGALDQLRRASSELKRLEALDPAWAIEQVHLAQVISEVEDIAFKVEKAASLGEYSPEQAEKTEARLHQIEKILRRYGPDEAQALERLAAAHRELDSLEDHDAGQARRQAQAVKDRQIYSGLALAVSQKRSQVALALKKEVEKELIELGMEKARFESRMQRRPDPEGLFEDSKGRYWGGAGGCDELEFLLSANPGEEPKSLAKVASGGELSRVTLALKKALGSGQGPLCRVFDEVDSGVSGRVADKVGAKISALAQQGQVLCVTHLPQIACQPATHFRVSKSSQGQQTHLDVKRLKPAEREAELAAMIDTEKVSESALAHARSLLQGAAAR